MVRGLTGVGAGVKSTLPHVVHNHRPAVGVPPSEIVPMAVVVEGPLGVPLLLAQAEEEEEPGQCERGQRSQQDRPPCERFGAVGGEYLYVDEVSVIMMPKREGDLKVCQKEWTFKMKDSSREEERKAKKTRKNKEENKEERRKKKERKKEGRGKEREKKKKRKTHGAGSGASC